MGSPRIKVKQVEFLATLEPCAAGHLPATEESFKFALLVRACRYCGRRVEIALREPVSAIVARSREK